MGGGDGKVDSPVRVRRHHRHPFLSVSISPPKGTGERSGYRREFIFKRGGRGGEPRPTDRREEVGGVALARLPLPRERESTLSRNPATQRSMDAAAAAVVEGSEGSQMASHARQAAALRGERNGPSPPAPAPSPREQARCTDYSIAGVI